MKAKLPHGDSRFAIAQYDIQFREQWLRKYPDHPAAEEIKLELKELQRRFGCEAAPPAPEQGPWIWPRGEDQ